MQAGYMEIFQQRLVSESVSAVRTYSSSRCRSVSALLMPTSRYVARIDNFGQLPRGSTWRSNSQQCWFEPPTRTTCSPCLRLRCARKRQQGRHRRQSKWVSSHELMEAVRMRPDAVNDPAQMVSRFLRPAVAATSPNSLVVEPSTATAGSRDTKHHAFTFDRVYDLNAKQEEIFRESVDPLVQRFLDGYNATVFAYGQTSSGKSYSMGTSEVSEFIPIDDPLSDLNERVGIIPRAAQQICAALSSLDDDAVEYKLSVSFLELYNEELIDLLSDPDEERAPVQIRETRTGDIVWMGLRQHTVHNAQDMVRLLQDGMTMRQTHETDMNTASSRSHAIFSVTLTQSRRSQEVSSTVGRTSPEKSSMFPRTPRSGIPTLSGRAQLSRNPSPTRPQTPTRQQTPTRVAHARATPVRRVQEEAIVTTTSKLHFVDLAGSERLKRTAAVGDRAKEGISINSGLHALGNVISLLSDPIRSKRASYIPYRDSKLTRLLQDSIGGNSQTLMIACVSTTEGNVCETLNTLQYAQRARRIRNTLERNQAEAGWDNVEYLQRQVTRLRKELELVRSSNELVIASPQKPNASLPTVHEQELLSWQEKCTALSRKNVELTTELLQREQEQRQAQQNAGDYDFLTAAEPVIMEYEKTVDGLESQINMLKAAVSYSEQVIHEQTESIKTATERADTAERQLDTLRETLRVLHDRLEERNARIEGMEAQLRRGPPSLAASHPSSTPTFASRRASLGIDTPQRSFGGILDYKGRNPSQRTYRVALHNGAPSGTDAENAVSSRYTLELEKLTSVRPASDSIVQPMHPHNL